MVHGFSMASAMSNQRVAVGPPCFPSFHRSFHRCPSCQRPCRQIWHQLVLSHPRCVFRTNWVKILFFCPKQWIHGWFQVYFKNFLTMNMCFCFFFLDDLWWRWFVDALASLPSESSYNVFVPWLLDEAIAMPIPWFTSHCGFLKSQRAARWLSPKNIWSVGIIIPFSIHFWGKKN